MSKIIAIQGGEGSYSHSAALKMFKNPKMRFCATFEEAFLLASQNPNINLVLPSENTIAGRVPGIHSLLQKYSLQIYAEHFEKINLNLLAIKGSKLETIKTVHSHIHALGQCRSMILNHKLKEVVESDTAFSAQLVAKKKTITDGAIASELAAKIYGLQILKSKIEDEPDSSTTRFIQLGKEPKHPEYDKGKKYITSAIFQLKSIPSALQKALSSFSGYSINLCRLESIALKNTFKQVAFYIEIESHIESDMMKKALEELSFMSTGVTICGCYPADSYRLKN